jgi:hydroxymethylpyrimidine pyrophosphatase-like HAD family hydrolase
MMIVLPYLYLLGCLFEANAFVVSPSTTTTTVANDGRLFAGNADINMNTAGNISASTSTSSPRDLDQLKIIFSDVDGALIHYPKKNKNDDNSDDQEHNSILALPPSATGMKGIISSQTLLSCRDLRRRGVKLVLVSGMRTSTLLNRLPYLPRADAYCTEAGGRIFYPTQVDEQEEEDQWTPMEFNGAVPEDLQPFGLREDRAWRKRMELEHAAGKDGYAGNEVSSDRLCDEDDDDVECLIDYDNPVGFPKQQDVTPIQQRKGALWDYARQLQDDYDFVLDTKSYSTCFRVNRKHQAVGADGKDKFQALLKGDIPTPSQLGKTTNLGCIDIYPVSSGKRNWYVLCCAVRSVPLCSLLVRIF